MGNVLNAAVSFPAVIFTVTSIFLFGFWVVTTALGSGLDSIADFETDVDSDVDLDSDGGGGVLRTVFELLGVTGMPVLLGLNIMSIAAWAAAMIGQLLLGGGDGTVGVLVGLLVLLGALMLGRSMAKSVAQRFDQMFTPTPALRRRDLVGSVCTVTTRKVTADFGQAEVRDREGGSLIVQVRSDKPNDLSAGDKALIFDVDDELGAFQVMENPELGP